MLLLPAYLFPISVSIAVGALIIADISWGYWLLVSCLTMMGMCCIAQVAPKRPPSDELSQHLIEE